MQETINTAREKQGQSLPESPPFFFFHFHKSHPHDCPEVISSRMERESLQFLKAKAGMHHLQSMAHCEKAFNWGQSCSLELFVNCYSIYWILTVPAAFESIVRSSHLTKNIHNAMGSLLQSATRRDFLPFIDELWAIPCKVKKEFCCRRCRKGSLL